MDESIARAQLEAEKTRLSGVLTAAGNLRSSAEEAAERELGSNEQHAAEQASETLERELDQSVVERVQQELEEVHAALARLDEGTYGTCEVCGKQIADGRLEAMPATRYCVNDASQTRQG